MFNCAGVLWIVAVVAALLGFTGMAGEESGTAKVVSGIFVVLFLATLAIGRRCPPLFRKSRGSRRFPCGQSWREKAAKFRGAARPRGTNSARPQRGASKPPGAVTAGRLTSGTRAAGALGPVPAISYLFSVRPAA